MSAEHSDKKCDDALHYQRITLSLEHQFPVFIVCLNPHATLAAFDEVALRLVLFVKRFQFVAQINKQLIFIHPVFEAREFLYHFVLQFIDCHIFLFSCVQN